MRRKHKMIDHHEEDRPRGRGGTTHLGTKGGKALRQLNLLVDV